MLTNTPALGQRRPSVQHRSISYGPVNNDDQAPRFHSSPQAIARPAIIRSSSSSEFTPAKIHPPQRAATTVLVLDDVEKDDLDVRPRKKARLEIDSKEDITRDLPGDNQQEKIKHVVTGTLVGIPPLQVGYHRESERTTGSGMRDGAARRADGLAPPSMAPRLPPPPQMNVADFFPWTGLHPEDRLDEQVVKSGYADKALSPNQNESSSAKQTLWAGASQKNHIALHNLSSLFTQVLEKRQTLGRFTAQSTFKPPPRVTVTDTKREAWLRDLANPSVPLRRQSRTIPHGIRGRSLLEQCILKSIPLQRAVWLAKCVGANELRAFRRKGVSGSSSAQGEAKWIREWTLSVEQFLHDTMHKFGNDWKTNIEYAIRLTSTLFFEGLLEKDHFLNWLLGCLSESHLDLLPMWLLVAQSFWTDFLSFERVGRKLARSLLRRLSDIVSIDRETYQSLTTSLEHSLRSISEHGSGCLVMPRLWAEYDHALQSLPNYTKLRGRNERMTAASNQDQQKSALVRLCDLLDHANLELDFSLFSRQCAAILPDCSALVTALLRYASTRYRDSKPHLFLVRKLVAKYAQEGVDVDGAMLLLLSQPPGDVDLGALFVVIADLIAGGCASAGRYVQWLITAGVVANSQARYADLLQALSSNNLPQHLRNTIMSLLNRAGRTSFSDFAVQETIKRIEVAMASTASSSISYPRGMLDEWILRKAKVLAESGEFSLHIFCTARSLLERSGRPEALQQLLELSLVTDDFRLLGSIADTVNLHALEFAISSALHDLVDELVSRYRALRTQQPLERTSIHALRDLVIRVPGKSAVQRLLDNDLAIYEQQNLNAACSPASDSLINMQAGNMDSDEEIDAVFASGNTMDEMLMGRVFQRIMQVAARSGKGGEKIDRVCQWLVQLRLLDRTTFDERVTAYLSDLGASSDALRGAYALVASDCIRFEQVANQYGNHAGLLNFTMESLPADLGLSDVEQYHFRQRQQSYCKDHCAELSHVMRMVLQTQRSTIDEKFAEFAIRLVSAAKLDPWLSASDDPLLLPNVLELSTIVLKHCEGLQLEGDMYPEVVARMATPLSSPFCSLWLKSYSLLNRSESEQEACHNAIIEAIQAKSPVWPQLLAACGSETTQRLHGWALQQVLGDEVCGEETRALFDATITPSEGTNLSIVLSATAARLKIIEKCVHEDANSKHQSVDGWLRAVLHVVLMSSQQGTGDQSTSSRSQIVLLLCSILSSKLQMDQALAEYVHDVISLQIDLLPMDNVTLISEKLRSAGMHDSALSTLLPGNSSTESWLSLATPVRSTKLPGNSTMRPSLALQTGTMNKAAQRGQLVDMKYAPYLLKRWDIIQDPAPVIGENDSSINLALFDARKAF